MKAGLRSCTGAAVKICILTLHLWQSGPEQAKSIAGSMMNSINLGKCNCRKQATLWSLNSVYPA